MKARLRTRNAINAAMFALTGLFSLITASVLLFILGYLVWNGARALNLAFFTQLPKPPGEAGGGMANAIAGSVELILVAMMVGAPIGFLAGVYLAERDGGTFPFLVRFTADILNGVPSIVLGIFAYALLVVPLHHFSVLAGGAALAVIFMPIALRTSEQALRAVPPNLKEGALALGAARWQAIATAVVPAAFRGLATGMLLALARVAGETAPLLFTSFNNRFWSDSLTQPVASLPVMIFTYAISPYADWHRQAWGAGLVLLGIILVTNVAARGFLKTTVPGR